MSHAWNTVAQAVNQLKPQSSKIIGWLPARTGSPQWQLTRGSRQCGNVLAAITHITQVYKLPTCRAVRIGKQLARCSPLSEHYTSSLIAWWLPQDTSHVQFISAEFSEVNLEMFLGKETYQIAHWIQFLMTSKAGLHLSLIHI